MAPVQQVPLEVQLAQGLAGNEPASRDKTFETLRKFVRLQLPHLDEPLTNNDFIKIWKGIHYRLWMQDKPLLQEKLVDQICQLLPLFPSEEYAMMYIRSFYETEAREWNGIDQLRLDKYMMLVREFVNSVFVFLCKSGWKKDLIKQVNVILEETVFNFDSVMQPHSLQLHLIDIYPLELMKVVDDQFSPDIATSIFSVFIHVFPVVRNVSVINKLFTLLQNTIFEEMSPGDRTKKKRKVLNGIQERDVTHFENHVKLAVDRKQFLSLLLDTASNERGSFKRRNQLYNLIKRIKSVELNKSSEKGGGGEEEEKPKKKKKSKKAKVAAIRDVDVEDAALELKKFEEKLSEDIPSQKRLKRIQRKQERLEKKLKKKAAKDNEEEAEDDEGEEEEEEVVAAEFIQFEADEEGDSDGEWIDDGDDDDDDDDDYDMFNDEDLDDSFIVDDDDDEEEEEEEDGSEEEEEVEGVADEDDSEEEEEEEVVTPRKKQKTSHVKKGSVLNNVISDDDEEEEEDYGYDEENEEEEEEGSDDGLEYDVEEAFLNLEMDSEEEEGGDGDDDDGEEEAEGEKEDKSQSNNKEDYDDDDDVGCYVVDVSTDTCGDDDDDDDGDDDEDQNIQSKSTKKQTVCDKKKTKKKKKSVDVSKTESEASSSSSKRKCSEEEDSEDTIEKRMKMMVDMMMMESDNETKEDVEETKGDVEETKTKQKRKKKKNKNKKTGKVESKKTGAGAASNNMFTLVDFEEETEEETENKSLLVEKKAATNGENTDETSTKPKKKQKKKKQQEKELTSTSTFPLPAGLESSPKVQEVVHQLKSIMNEKQMRRTEGADKKMKKKLNRYFDMVSKDNLLNEVSSDVPNGNTDQSGIDFVQDGINGLDQVSKDKKKSKKRKRKPDQQKENLAKFCESPPAFFQVAVSKVKKATKQKNRTPKSIPESYGVSLDRKSVSFDMKQNKAFLPETPISSESPYNSQKKPKTGILKPSPSPILVRKQKKKKKTTMQIMKRPKASDFF
ncbi:midasin-like [Argonauta hians]